ncbi:unnamed protein product [Adineta ricciae]|uniref:Uncharacterized protein n=1 Tax=Adineta ricciae TaxID=249248 RepID=A0A815VPC0_ADIRI|nr:unnamed protein product [Adineta ricciae]CAF1535525.1 unnamed protein product [Adineta ricciae]
MVATSINYFYKNVHDQNSVDDILYGYDVLFENEYLFTASSCLGVQYQSIPNDAMVFQQLIWRIKPDLIIDLGTNVGGSAVFFASIMPFYSDVGIVLTIDRESFTMDWVPDRRTLCKDCVNATDNKLWKKYVHFIQGSTNDVSVLAEVKKYAANGRTVFISHDAAHDCDSVYEDLINYTEFFSINSYMVVQDTKLDRMKIPSRGPLAVVRKFLDY